MPQESHLNSGACHQHPTPSPTCPRPTTAIQSSRGSFTGSAHPPQAHYACGRTRRDPKLEGHTAPGRVVFSAGREATREAEGPEACWGGTPGTAHGNGDDAEEQTGENRLQRSSDCFHFRRTSFKSEGRKSPPLTGILAAEKALTLPHPPLPATEVWVCYGEPAELSGVGRGRANPGGRTRPRPGPQSTSTTWPSLLGLEQWSHVAKKRHTSDKRLRLHE